MTFIEFAENVLGVELLNWQKIVLEHAQECKDNGEIYYIYPYFRVGKAFLNKIIQQKLVYDRACYQGAREFAEWLERNGKKYGVDSDVYIPNLLSEWQKEVENELF